MWLKILFKALRNVSLIKATKIGRGKSPNLGKKVCNEKARLVAIALVNFIQDEVKKEQLGLRPVSPFKTKVLGKSRTPMFDTGAMLEHLKYKKGPECTYIVYWDKRRIYEKRAGRNDVWTGRTMVDWHRHRRDVKLSGTKKKKWAKWFWTQVTKAGYSLEDIKHQGGRPGQMTQEKRDFFDKAVARFKAKMQGKNGVTIFSHQYDDKTILIRAN